MNSLSDNLNKRYREDNMNQFHEINLLTSRGDINGALSLINCWTESVARKIMKKAGYPVPSDRGRSFWLWVQQTLMQAVREKRSGYTRRFSRSFSCVRHRAQNDYEEYVRMMAEPVMNVGPAGKSEDIFPCQADNPSEAEFSPQGSVMAIDTGTEVGIRIAGFAEGVINTYRHAEPAAAGPVAIFQLEKACADVVAHKTENRRVDGMRFHFPARSLLSLSVEAFRSRVFNTD